MSNQQVRAVVQCCFLKSVYFERNKARGKIAKRSISQMYHSNCCTESAKGKEDEELLLEIQRQDLIAKEAQYHTSCRKEYTRKLKRNVLKSETVGAEEQRAHTWLLNNYPSSLTKGL